MKRLSALFAARVCISSHGRARGRRRRRPPVVAIASRRTGQGVMASGVNGSKAPVVVVVTAHPQRVE